ncbi:uracil-DNA glycosylase [Halobacteriales archaeon Cl-PHB]
MDDPGDPTDQMDGLRVTECQRCPDLVDSRSQIVSGTGPADADLVFVGEAPGANEDEQGEPFVGRSGDVLDETLREAGLDRADVRITNCVRCRPPDNRDPHVEELANCKGYLAAELARIDPDLVVTLGKVPAEHLLERDVAITSEAGEIFDCELGEAAHLVMLSVHPAATLYDPSQGDTFRSTIEKAVDYVDAESGQRRIGDF